MRLSTRGRKFEDIGAGGGDRPVAGRYHVVVKSVDNSHTTNPTSIPTEFEVLAGTAPGQEGKTTIEFFYYDLKNVKDFARDRIIRFAQTCGLIGDNEDKDVDLLDAIGKQLVIQLVDDTYEDKKTGEERKSVRIARDGGMWPLNHEDVREVPKSQAAIDLATAPSTSSPPGGRGDVAADTASSASDDLWDNI